MGESGGASREGRPFCVRRGAPLLRSAAAAQRRRAAPARGPGARGCDLQVGLAADPLPDLGEVDVCVSNAAITDTIAPAHRMTEEQWRRYIEVNLTGAFRVVQACLPAMREREW